MNVSRDDSDGSGLSPGNSAACLLFVDDDRDVQAAARLLFRRRGIEMLSAQDARDALTQLASHSVDLVLLDLNYTRGATGGEEGLALLRDMLVLRPDLPVIVVTGHSGVAIAVEAMRAGATDFVMKPWSNERLVTLVGRKLEERVAGQTDDAEPVMIVSSPELSRIIAEADRLAPTRAPFVISGPPGVGKAILARRIHALSHDTGAVGIIRAEECDALPEKGRSWIIRDVEALSPQMQRCLADRLDEGGAPRVIALSTLDRTALETRLDPRLMLHLGMVMLTIPPLHRRPDDIAALTTHFLRYFAVRHRLPEPDADEACLAALKAGTWPQNVRSLRAAVERAVLTGNWHVPVVPVQKNMVGPATLHDAERTLVETALRKHSFNVTQAARELGITRPALYRRMARHGL